VTGWLTVTATATATMTVTVLDPCLLHLTQLDLLSNVCITITTGPRFTHLKDSERTFFGSLPCLVTLSGQNSQTQVLY
jgi:hypothetical protein